LEPEGRVFHLGDVPYTMLVEGARSRLIAGKSVLVSFIEMEPGMTFPVHSHPCEQVMIVLEGGITQRLGETVLELRPGDVCIMPPGLSHGGKVSEEGCKAIDIFSPPREDYLRRAAR